MDPEALNICERNIFSFSNSSDSRPFLTGCKSDKGWAIAQCAPWSKCKRVKYLGGKDLSKGKGGFNGLRQFENGMVGGFKQEADVKECRVNWTKLPVVPITLLRGILENRGRFGLFYETKSVWKGSTRDKESKRGRILGYNKGLTACKSCLTLVLAHRLSSNLKKELGC